jgi:GH24 family phage-related lysozyme (muramidase)
MGDSEYQERLNMIAEKEQQLKLVTAEIQDFGREKADKEIENVKIEAKIKKDEKKNPFVAEVKKELRSKEGLELEAYKPVDSEEYFTIGYGHYGPDVEEGMVITEARAEELLHEDVMVRIDEIKNLIPDFVTFSEDQQTAIFSEYYRGSIAGSPNAVKFINSKDYAKAAEEYLNNDEYRNARRLNKAGIRPRMEAVADALLELDKETYPEKYENQNNNSLLSRVTDIFN